MKKVLVILLLAVMLVSVCACSYVPSTRFLSRSQLNSLLKEYGTPQAELTIKYTINNDDYEIKVTYNLLLSQTPLAVIRFIQLANDGAYNDTVIDTFNSTYNYMIMGRYIYKDSVVSEGKKNWYVNNALDVTFKGEFKSNGYSEPSGGYAQFKNFSLAMFHDESTAEDNNFDTANGALILAVDSNTLNSNNYAVFAELASMTYSVNGGKPITRVGKVDSDICKILKGFTSKTGIRTVYTDETETDTIPSFTMMNQIVTIQVKILGDHDWSKLPRIGK